MSKVKAYCVIKKDGYVYFPIKAEWNPYVVATKSYLPCMPNFFGGTVEAGESICSTLIGEVSQESQNKIRIDSNAPGGMDMFMSACKELKQVTFENRGNTTEYYFYSVNADACPQIVTIDNFENRFVLSTDASRWNAKYREMSCILKVPVNQLHKNFDNFLEQCIEKGRGYIYNKETITGHPDWNDEGTQDAFKEFCREYGV